MIGLALPKIRGHSRESSESFLDQKTAATSVPYPSVPARVEDLGKLAPAFRAVGALDLFVMEDIGYAWQLISHGVPTELHVYPGAVHGFDAASGAIHRGSEACAGSSLQTDIRTSFGYQ